MRTGIFEPSASGYCNVGTVENAYASGVFEDFKCATAIFDKEFQNGDSGSEATIDWTRSNKQSITLTGAPCVFAFVAPAGACNLVLRCVQGSGGSKTATWPSVSPGKVRWASQTAPTLSTTAGYEDVVALYYNGTDYYSMATMGF